MSLCCCTALFFFSRTLHMLCNHDCLSGSFNEGHGKEGLACVCVCHCVHCLICPPFFQKKKTLIHSTPHCVNYSLTPCSLSIATSRCSQVHSPANATQVLIQQVALISSFNLTIHTNGFSKEQSEKGAYVSCVWCH